MASETRAARAYSFTGPETAVSFALAVCLALATSCSVLAQAATPGKSDEVAESGSGASPSARRLAEWLDDFADVPRLDVSALGDPYRPSVFAQVQFRTEADRLNPNRQRYAVRAEPRLPYLRRAERELQDAQRAALPVADAPAEREGAAEALAVLFDLVTVERANGELAANIHLHDSLLAVTRLRLVEPGFDVERLLDVEDDRSELAAARDAGDALLARQPLPVPADAIVSAAAALARASDLLALGVRPDGRLAAELALIDAAVAFERADNWKVIDFVQLDYRSDLEQDERFSVGFGIALPHARVRKLDELELERVEETHRARLRDRERQRDLERAYADLLAAADELFALQAVVAERRRRRDRLAGVLATSAETRPDDLLRIRRRNLRDRLDLIDAEADVLEAYAELLAESGWVDADDLDRWVLE